MAAVEWACTKMHYGDGFDSEPWACIEYYPKMRPPKYYWWAHRPGTENVDGWTETLEDAQRLCEDTMFGETEDGNAGRAEDRSGFGLGPSGHYTLANSGGAEPAER